MGKPIPVIQRLLEPRKFSLTQQDAGAIAIPRSLPWPRDTGISSFAEEMPMDQGTMDSFDE
jgi:hypothetical protein